MIYRRKPSFLGRFLRARKGATAIEFAFVAIPFLLLLMGIVELGLIFTVNTGLDGATSAAARQIRTGEFQSSGAASKTAFRNLVCEHLAVLPSSCTSNLYVDVKTFDSFDDLAKDLAQEGAAFNPNSTCFSPGVARDIVLVRTYYIWPLVTPGLTGAFANADNGAKRLMTSISAFRNEPYDDIPSVGAKCS